MKLLVVEDKNTYERLRNRWAGDEVSLFTYEREKVVVIVKNDVSWGSRV